MTEPAYAALERWRAGQGFVGYGEQRPEDIDRSFIAGFEAAQEILKDFTARRSDDDVKRDLELTCDDCGSIVCDIEPDDSMDILAEVMQSHRLEYHRRGSE